MSTLHYLSVAELQSILAHEYAHFSHRDTFYHRFIYQVSLSIQEALAGMAQSGGNTIYVNPFFWFLYVYHLSVHVAFVRVFTLAGIPGRPHGRVSVRLRCLCQGAGQVSTDGTLFEIVIYNNIAKLLEQSQCFANMYVAFRSFRDEQMGTTES